MGVYLAYDMRPIKEKSKQKKEQGDSAAASVERKIERFYNQKLGFSISWYPNIANLYNDTL